MYMVEISENKVEKMSDYAEKMLRYGGKAWGNANTPKMITTMMKWVNAAGMAVVDTETVEVIPVE